MLRVLRVLRHDDGEALGVARDPLIDEGYELRIEAVPLMHDRRARAVIIQDVTAALPSGGASEGSDLVRV